MCPAIILANNRIAKLIGLKKNDNISIGTKSNNKVIGILPGKNNNAKLNLCYTIPKILINTNNKKLTVKVEIN